MVLTARGLPHQFPFLILHKMDAVVHLLAWVCKSPATTILLGRGPGVGFDMVAEHTCPIKIGIIVGTPVFAARPEAVDPEGFCPAPSCSCIMQ